MNNVTHLASYRARKENEKYRRIAAKLTKRCPVLKCELPAGHTCELCKGCDKPPAA